MNILLIRKIFCALLAVSLLSFCTKLYAENIDPDNDGSQYIYGENIGWISLEPGGDGGPGVEAGDASLSSYMWGENVGWIDLHPPNGGVLNDGLGHLSGYAWGENTGWINFAPENGGVIIDPDTGEFSGYAWGENTGWISFRGTAPVDFKVKTSWRAPAPALSVNDASAIEGNSGTVNAAFTVTLSRTSSQTVTVDYATADGTASQASGDYVAASGSLSFAPGEISKTLNVSVRGDTVDENDETFYLNLSNAANATLSDGQAVGTITDDDATPNSAGSGGSGGGCFIAAAANGAPMDSHGMPWFGLLLILGAFPLLLIWILLNLYGKKWPVLRTIVRGGIRHE